MLTLRKNRQTTFIIYLDCHQPPGLQDRHIFTHLWRQAVAEILALLVVLGLFGFIHFIFSLVFQICTRYFLSVIFKQSHLAYILFACSL